MSCSTYAEERLQPFNVAAAHIPFFQELDSESQFESLMSCNGKPVLQQQVQYVHVCMHKRQLLL